MNEPRVDIYMPTYKPHEDHLRASVESVLNQTETNWHLWINDQVTDVATESFVQDYLNDERISYNRNTDHPGIGANWNDCLQHGSAPVIQYMFQDDVWEPHFLESGLQVLDEHADVGMVSLAHTYIFEGDIPTENIYQDLIDFLNEHVQAGHHNGQEFLLQWMEHGLHPNVVGEPMFVMLRRDTVNQVGRFREDMQQNLDSEYWARVLAKTNWYYLDGAYGTFRVHFDSASMRNYRSGKGIFDRYRMMRSIIPLLPSEHRKRGKQILSKQLGGMMEKFFQRYAGAEDVHFPEGGTPLGFGLRHPLLVLKGAWNYCRKRT